MLKLSAHLQPRIMWLRNKETKNVKAIESILLILALACIAIAGIDMVFFTGLALPITGLLMALVMLEFVRIIALWESNDKGADKHE